MESEQTSELLDAQEMVGPGEMPEKVDTIENPEIIRQVEESKAQKKPEAPSPTVLTAASVTPSDNVNHVEGVCKSAPEHAVIVVNQESLADVVYRHRPDCEVRVKPEQTVPALWRVSKFR